MSQSDVDNSCWAAARDYAALGLGVIPIHTVVDAGCDCGDADCKSPGKHPRTRRGLRDASTDPVQIGRWAMRWPQANIAIITGAVSGIVVLDVDGDEGEISLANLEDEYGAMPNTVSVATGGGGRHLIFRHPGGKVPNSSGKLGNKLDVRGDGGYIVVPPSNHISGNSYRWIVPPQEIAPAELPDWLLERMQEKPARKPAPRKVTSRGLSADRYTRFVFNQVLAELAGAVEGNRNDTLNKAAFRLGQFVGANVISRGEVEQALHDQASALGLGERETELTIRSGIDSGMSEPAEIPEPKTATRKSEDKPASDELDEPHGAQLVPLGERDPDTGRLVLSPRRTLPTARSFVEQFHTHPDGITLRSYAGLLMAWRDNRYLEIEDELLRHRLQPWLHEALRYVTNRQTGEPELVDFESNPGTINSALDSIRSFVHLPASVSMPSWLEGHTAPCDAREVLPCRTLNLHIPAGTVIPATPMLFTGNALEFDFDPTAPLPKAWLNFLNQLWPDDPEQITTLQEWFGYSLIADTSQQKILLMVGPKRSGKGTIGRVLTKLVGAANVVGPTTGSLAGAFGLQPLVGKSLAIVSDARFTGENVAIVVERLLCISGEDMLTIDRKFLPSVSMKLPTRFMLLTNELPRMNDASGALAGRFIILRLTQSFYGKEDTDLTKRLTTELPGILLWALEGWKRLRERGRFEQPKSVADVVQDMEDLASPVAAFVRDCCVVAPDQRVWIDDVYQAWKSWCEREGRALVTTKQVFGRDLTAAVAGISTGRSTGPLRFYKGISLKGEIP